METVKLSSKYQVVIPVQVRESLNLKPGQKFRVQSYQNRIEFIPVIKIEESRGIFKGIDTEFERERDPI